MTRNDIIKKLIDAQMEAYFDGYYIDSGSAREHLAALAAIAYEAGAAAKQKRIEELEKITGDMANAVIELQDKYKQSESADVKAMNEAQIVLQTIKDIDPGVYDEMIDNALRLIADALNIVAEEEVK